MVFSIIEKVSYISKRISDWMNDFSFLGLVHLLENLTIYFWLVSFKNMMIVYTFVLIEWFVTCVKDVVLTSLGVKTTVLYSFACLIRSRCFCSYFRSQLVGMQHCKVILFSIWLN